MAHLLQDLITNAAWQHPQHAALRWEHGAYDYAALTRAVELAAQALLALGIRRGERVAVLLDQRPEALLALFGALAAGATCVPIDPRLNAGQVALILRDSSARILVTTPGARTALQSALLRCPELRCVVQTCLHGDAVPGLAVFSWDNCLLCAPGLSLVRSGEDEAAALVYPSGGSGGAHAQVLSHRALLMCAKRVGTCLGAGARSLNVLAFSDSCALSLLAGALTCASATVLAGKVSTCDLAALAASEHITALAAPPWLWMQSAGANWHAARALCCITSVGGALPRPTFDALRRRMPQARLYLLLARRACWDDGDLAQLRAHPDDAQAQLLPAN